ncbi:MAG: hypothetical protein OEW12_09410 [Deltaproteobacteria bacterium]|nr:hypothetical protein [Deltaproteobacteria bacterium]
MTLELDKTPQQVRERKKNREDSSVLTLPDESDQIILDLKTRLSSLQQQLAKAKGAHVEGSPATGAPPQRDPGGESAPLSETREAEARFHKKLAPGLTARLADPARDLTARLERLITQVSDPELKGELEKCRQTAFFLFDTFQQITKNHRLLTESLSLKLERVTPQALGEALVKELKEAGLEAGVELSPNLPQTLEIVPRAAATLARILSKVASELAGEGLKVGVAPGAGAPGWLELSIQCKWDWSTLAGGGKDVSTVVFKPGVTANAVVDWLYVEKILELQQGEISFNRSQGMAGGFLVRLPIKEAGSAKV